MIRTITNKMLSLGLSIILALCFIWGVFVPEKLLAAETSDADAAYSIKAFQNIDAEFQTIDGETVSSGISPSKDVELLIFGATTCASTWLTLSYIAESDWIQDSSISVIYVDINGADAEKIRGMIEQYATMPFINEEAYRSGCEKIIFCHDAEKKNEEVRTVYHSASGKWETLYMPMIMLIDKHNIVREMLTNCKKSDEILPVINQVIATGNAVEEDKKDETGKDDTDNNDDKKQTYTDLQGVIYSLNEDGTCVVSGGTENLQSAIKIPSFVTVSGKEYTVKKIEDNAFSGCSSLTEVILSEGIVSIGNSAFARCINLRDIYYAGSEEQWKHIYIDDQSIPDTVKIHFTDSSVESACIHTYKSAITTQPDCTKTGVRTYICTKCGSQYTETLAKTNHIYDNGRCKLCGQADPSAQKAKAVPLAKGRTFTDSKTKCRFKVTSSSAAKPTAAFTGVTKKTKKVTIPASITYQGITYQITSVSVKALKGNTKITSLIVGSNVTKIEKNAFEGCKNLKKITVKSKKLTSIGKNTLKGIHKNCKIKVPSSKLKTYKKLFKKKGQKTSVKISG